MTTINQLSTSDTLTAGDLLPIWRANNSDTRKTSLTTLQAYMQNNLTFPSVTDAPKIVATYAELTALTTVTGLVNGGIYYTIARTTVEDGGAGFWRYDAASSATANGGTILAIDSSALGRFFRQYSGAANVLWFGAKGDGATNDAAAFNAALAAHAVVYMPGTANGYRVTSTITAGLAGQVLFGDGPGRSYFNLASHTFDVILCANNLQTFEDFRILNFGTASGNVYGIKNLSYYNVRLRNLFMTDMDRGWIHGSDTDITAARCEVRQCLITLKNASTGIGGIRGGASEIFDLIDTIHEGPSGGQALYGFWQRGGVATNVENFEVSRCGVPWYVNPPTGIGVNHTKFSRVWCDSSTIGLHFNCNAGTVQDFTGTDLWACGNSSDGVKITGIARGVNICTGQLFQNGGRGLTIDDNADVYGLNICNMEAGGNVSAPFVVGENVSNWRIAGWRAGTVSAFGANGFGPVIEAGTGANFEVTGNNFVGNSGAVWTNDATGVNQLVANNLGILSGSATFDPGSLADGAGETTTVTAAGAALGDIVSASFSNNLQGITVTAWCNVAGTYSVRFQNESGGLLDLASGTLFTVGQKRT